MVVPSTKKRQRREEQVGLAESDQFHFGFVNLEMTI